MPGVVYAGIDTDKHRYPIGSGRVTFDSEASYMRAVASAFVEIKCQKFCKKVQLKALLPPAPRWTPTWRTRSAPAASSLRWTR